MQIKAAAFEISKSLGYEEGWFYQESWFYQEN
jgi:hypothetical protein